MHKLLTLGNLGRLELPPPYIRHWPRAIIGWYSGDIRGQLECTVIIKQYWPIISWLTYTQCMTVRRPRFGTRSLARTDHCVNRMKANDKVGLRSARKSEMKINAWWAGAFCSRAWQTSALFTSVRVTNDHETLKLKTAKWSRWLDENEVNYKPICNRLAQEN